MVNFSDEFLFLEEELARKDQDSSLDMKESGQFNIIDIEAEIQWRDSEGSFKRRKYSESTQENNGFLSVKDNSLEEMELIHEERIKKIESYFRSIEDCLLTYNEKAMFYLSRNYSSFQNMSFNKVRVLPNL